MNLRLVDEAEIHEKVNAALKELEPQYRNLLADRFFRGLTVEAIADNCNCSLRTVRRRLRKAEKDFRNRIEETGLGLFDDCAPSEMDIHDVR
jgi:RNA polymerase sigma factor (sigma-70 family)